VGQHGSVCEVREIGEILDNCVSGSPKLLEGKLTRVMVRVKLIIDGGYTLP